MGGSSDSNSDERSRDVVHDYVGRLPDNAAPCLDIGGVGGWWSEDTLRIRAFLFIKVTGEKWRKQLDK